MAEHTPGPWHLDRDDDMMRGSNGRTVCDGIGLTDEDARLIAAAPDLLYALEMVRDADNDEPHIPRPARNCIDAALRKALGEDA